MRRRERGTALLQAILFTTLLAAAVSVVATSAMERAHRASVRADRVQAFYAAEAGAASAIERVASGDLASGLVHGRIGRGKFHVRVERSGGDIVVRAVGTCGSARREVAVHAPRTAVFLRGPGGAAADPRGTR